MSDLSVTERRIRPIQDAAAAKNWKQALQLCDKWHKKGEKSDRFLALKASVLINQHDKAQIEKGKQEVLGLCQRKNAVTDIEALYQLQHSLKRLSLQNEEGSKLWERAASTVPNDKGLVMSWLNGALDDSNWLMAQKAAMTLRKSFPKERQYEFWNILLCYLAHTDLSLSEKDRTLFGTLAYRLISKAAEAIPVDPLHILAPGKAVATTEEVALLLHIYLSTSHTTEAIELLRGPTIGLGSNIAEKDNSMVFSLLLQALQACSSSTAVLEVCQWLVSEESLPVQDVVEDERLWRIVIKAGRDDGARTKCLALVQGVLDKNASCRVAHLAKLSLLRQLVDEEANRRTQLADACTIYFELFRTKPFCFEDLYETLSSLDHEDIKKFISQASSEENPAIEQLFALKVEYLVLGRHVPVIEETFQFATKVLHLSRNWSRTSNEYPEANLLAALAILRLAASVKSFDLVLQACLILEASYARSEEYYYLAVRLVQVYRSIGLFSLATERFTSLSIKNMQWETVGHLLLTRISTLHPLPTRHDEASLNPLFALDTGLEMLDNMEMSLNKAIQKGMKFGSYSNVLNTVVLKDDVQRSLNRQIFAIEERKIQSLVNVPVVTVLEPYAQNLTDMRDFSFLSNYGVVDKTLDGFLSCGPLPAQMWLDVMTFFDHLHQYLRFETIAQTMLASDALEALDKSSKSIKLQLDESLTALTNAEYESLRCRFLMYEIVRALHSPTSKQADIENTLDEIIANLNSSKTAEIESVNGVSVSGWQYLHTSFVTIETLQTVNLLAELLLRKAKSAKDKARTASKEKIVELQKAVAHIEAAIQSNVKTLRAGINSSGVLGQLIDAAAGRLVTAPFTSAPSYQAFSEVCNSLYDEAFVEEYCGKVRDSWTDALDNILAVKIKGPN